MIDKSILGQLKQTNIGQDIEKTKERVEAVWKSTDKSKREEIREYSGLQKFTFERSYKVGNISAKMAVALAEVLQINPFYLTGEEDEKDSYSEEKVREFLISKNYGDLLERPAKPKRRNVGKKTDGNMTVDTVSEAEEETYIAPTDENAKKDELVETDTASNEQETIQEPKYEAAAPATSFDLALTRIQEKLRNITDEKMDLLGKMPENEVQSLISALQIRAKYDEDSAIIVALTNLILTSM